MKDPIIITGAPRSRTSLVAQLLELSGLFLGRTLGATKANPQGQKEQRDIIDKVQKPHLEKYGYDRLGQNPLPPVNFDKPDPRRRQRVIQIMKNCGLKGQTWGFKDAKAVLDWRTWSSHFPATQWVIVRRKDEDIIKSCLRTSFMQRYTTHSGWQGWVNQYKIRMEDLQKNNEFVYVVDTDQLIAHDFEQIESAIKNLGLTWNPDKIKNQIKP